MNAPPHKFCHKCGADLERDLHPLSINGYTMQGESYPLSWGTKVVQMTAAERGLCWSLMKAFPHCVRAEVLCYRVGADDSVNTPAVLVCRLRKKFKEAGVPDPIFNDRGFGYYWVGGMSSQT